jgi:alkylation response protein AidB-like acyl-CoA dehydrogenase
MTANTGRVGPDAAWEQEHEDLIRRVRDRLRQEATAPRDSLRSLAIPAGYGGDDNGGGHGLAEQLVVMVETGRALAHTPYLSTVILVAGAVLDSGDEAACRDLLPRIAAGALTATVVLPGRSDGPTADVIAARAGRRGEGHGLTGAGIAPLDGETAGLYLVAARYQGRPTLFAVDRTAATVTSVPGPAPEPTWTTWTQSAETPLGRAVSFHDAPARPIGSPGDAERILARALRRAALGTAAEQAGGASRCLELTVAYARQRRQFGRPIGAFQAVGHKCADMRLSVEAAWSALDYAARAAAADAGNATDAEARVDAHWAASAAKSLCSEAYLRVAADAVQIHGGAGYRRDSEVQAHLRQALAKEYLFGDSGQHRRFCADLLVDAAVSAA